MSKAISLFRRRPELSVGAGVGLAKFSVSGKTIAGAELGLTTLAAKSGITSVALRFPQTFLKARADLVNDIINVAEHAARIIMNGNVGGAPFTISADQGKNLQILLGWRPLNAAGVPLNGRDLQVDAGLTAVGPGVAEALVVNLTVAISKAMATILDPQFKEGSKQAESKLLKNPL